MKQIYYVNGKRATFGQYINASAYNYQIEQEAELHKVKVNAFLNYLEKNPQYISKWSFCDTEEIAVGLAFNEFCRSPECKKAIEQYQSNQKKKAWGCLILVIVFLIIFILRVSGVI